MRYLPILALLFLLTSCTRVNVFPHDPGEQAPVQATASSTDEAKKDDSTDKDPFKPWVDVLKDTKAVEGVIKMHLKRDRTLYLELTPDQLGRDFGMALHFSRGVGDFFAYDGLYLTEMRLIRFERIGDQINVVHRNPRFTADEGSPMRTSLDENVGHSIIEVAKIESEHKESKNVLINVTDFFVSDYAEIADMMKFFYGGKSVSFEKKASYVESIQGFPENLEIDAALTFKTGGYPPYGGEAVSDYRSVPVGVRYSIMQLPDEPMNPRLADDRVGHFLTAKKDLSRDRKPDPYVRYVNRWRLEKKDPDAAVSEPVKPIVYYVDHSVPLEYRKYVKEGIEAWNKAFENAGFKNAVVAKDAPANDSTWSAEDIRYSTVRWSAAHRMGFAIGPSQVDPRSGQILNADILISSDFVRGWLNEYQRLGPEAMLQQFRGPVETYRRLPEHLRNRLCFAESGKAHQVGLQYNMLVGMGILDGGEPMPVEYLGDAVRDLVMHEVGHTLGLRHNFKASSGIPHDRLNDTEFTGKNGLSLSVMDYAPVNLTAHRDRQGHYWNMTVGTYDDWAVRYAYLPIQVPPPTASTGTKATSGTDGTNGAGTSVGSTSFDPTAESAVLDKIAREAGEPLHTYGTDEDNWLGAWAIDPLTSAWELGSDPLAFARDRAALVAQVTPELESRLIDDGEGYQRLRGGITSMLVERVYSLLPVTKTVGGIHFVRDHKGDPSGRLPFTPVSAEDQREAVELIVNETFAEDAFDFDAATLNKLAPNRFSHWGMSMGTPLDYPLHEWIDAVHAVFIEELMHPARFQRMIDNELRMADGQAYQVSEMLETLTGSVWSEVADRRPVSSFRRNLQRRYADQLIRLMLDSPSWRMNSSTGFDTYPTPEHVRSLSRLELMEIVADIDSALAAESVDRDTRAHLLESKARIDRALTVSISAELN